jgi:hypothetical protein
MRLLLALALTGGLAFAQAAPRVSRHNLATVERGFDLAVERISPLDPFYLLGNTRGLYLDGFGAIFTAEVNLVASAAANPFRPAFTAKEIAALRVKKLKRVDTLKTQMRSALVSSVTALEGVRPEEQVVLGVSLFYFKWEQVKGLPTQIVMQAPKKALIEAAKGNEAVLQAALRVQEY